MMAEPAVIINMNGTWYSAGIRCRPTVRKASNMALMWAVVLAKK